MDEYKVANKSLRDLLYIIFKHKGKIVLVSLAVTALAVFVISRQVPVYESTAKVLVKEGRENSTPTTAIMAVPERIVDITRQEDVNSEIEILRSRLLAERVVEKLGVDLTESSSGPDKMKERSAAVQSLHRIAHELKNLFHTLFPSVFPAPSPLSGLESALLRLQKNLEVNLIQNSNVIQISFSDPNPHVSADVVNTLLDFYLDQHLLVHKTPGAYQFFSDQAIDFQRRLEASEKKLEEFKKQSSLAELSLQREILIKQKGEYEDSLEQMSGEIDGLQKELCKQKEQLSQQKEQITLLDISRTNSLKDQLNSQLSQLRIQENKLMNMYADANQRAILDIRKEIQEVKSQLAELSGPPEQCEVQIGPNNVYLQLTESMLKNQADLESLIARRQNLQKNLLVCKQKLDDFNKSELELNQLERQIKIEEENYQLYRKKVEENRIYDAMDTARFANISVIEPGLLPLVPKPGRKALKAFIAVVLGLTAGLGAALLCEMLDHSVGTAEELEASLHVPVLGSIPDTKE